MLNASSWLRIVENGGLPHKKKTSRLDLAFDTTPNAGSTPVIFRTGQQKARLGVVSVFDPQHYEQCTSQAFGLTRLLP